MKNQIIDFLKDKWREGVIVLLVTVIVPLVYKYLDTKVTLTAYENQTQNLEEKLELLEKTKAKEKIITKYVKGDVVEKIVYRDLIVEKEVDRDKRSETKVVLPSKDKLWGLGVGYDVHTSGIYVRGSYTAFNLVYVEACYPIQFDGLNRLRVGAGLRF